MEKEAKDLKEAIPAIEVQAVENFCAHGGHFAKICDAYVVGFYKALNLALDQFDNLEGVEFPKEMGVTPELEAKILKKKGNVLAILQLIREEDPDLLAKWEIGQLSSSEADDSGAAQ